MLIYGIVPFFADYFVSGILPFGEEDEIIRCFMFLALLILVWGGFEMIPRMLLDAISVRNTEWQCFRIMDNFFLFQPDRIRKFSRGELMRSVLRPLSGASRNYDSFFAFFLHSSVLLAALIPLFVIGGSAVGTASPLLAGFFGAVACLVTFLAIVKAREAQKYRETYRRIIRETAKGIVHVRSCNAENNASVSPSMNISLNKITNERLCIISAILCKVPAVSVRRCNCMLSGFRNLRISLYIIDRCTCDDFASR